MSGGAYRSNADPETDVEIYSAKIAADGAEKKAILLFALICGGLMFTTSMMVTLGEEDAAKGSLAFAGVLWIVAYFVYRRRRRRLAIIRHGDAVRLEIAPGGLALRFPLTVRAAVDRTMDRRELQLQLVDAENRAVMICEILSSSPGQVDDWRDWDGDVDHALRFPRYDVGFGKLTALRAAIVEASSEEAA